MHQTAVRKGIIITTVCIILVIFIFIMNSGTFLKQSFSDNDDVEKYLIQLDRTIENEEWDKSLVAYDRLYEAWSQVERRVQYSVERDDIVNISHSIARLKGCVRSKNLDNAMINLEELKSYWKHLEN